MVLGIWQWYDSVPSYCQATFPYHTSQQPVIGAGLDWRDNKVCHHVQPGVRHLTNDNCSGKCCTWQAAGPGQRVYWCEKLCQPHRTTIRTETVNLDHCHQTGPVSGGTGNIVRIPNVPNVAHNLPVGSRLSPFWELRKPWGLDLR